MAPDKILSWDNSAIPSDENVHFLSHQEAADLMDRVLEQDRGRPATPAEFGRALHAIQDSYRHRGLGYTAKWGEQGEWQYVIDCGVYGETFDLGEALLNSTQWGHGGTSFLARFLKLPFVTDPDVELARSPWPDADAAMTEETRKWIEEYLQEYIAWYLQQTSSEQTSRPK